MNKENFAKVLQQIESHPETWEQTRWHCGTKHCLAGWAQILSGKEPNDNTVRRDARAFLDLSMAEADYLFDSWCSVEEFRDVLKNGFYNTDGYDRNGYDRDGRDRDGRDCDGYDRDGLDRNNKPRP